MRSLGARARRRLPVASDLGVGALEYLGVLGVTAALVAAVAVIPVAEPARLAVVQAICNFLGGDSCADVLAQERDLPKCETSFDSRSIGAKLTLFSITVGRTDEYEISRYGDGTARVMTGDLLEAGAGVEAGGGADLSFGDDGSMQGGVGASAELTGEGGLRLYYDFDSVDDADRWVDENRSALTQTLNFAGGPLADGAEQLWNALDDGRAQPSAFAVELSANLTGSAEAGYGGLAGASGEAGGKATGVYEQNLVNGTSSFSGTFNGTISAQGTLAMASASGEGSGTVGYTVDYDADGNPTAVTFSQVTSYEAAVGMNTTPLQMGGDTVDELGWDFDIGRWGGQQNNTMMLDLTVPANRAAFDAAFLRAGPVAGLTPTAALDGSMAGLAERLDADGLFATASYAVDTGGGGIDVSASPGIKFGLDVGADTLARQLLAANVYDARNPSRGVVPLATCG